MLRGCYEVITDPSKGLHWVDVVRERRFSLPTSHSFVVQLVKSCNFAKRKGSELSRLPLE